MSKAVRVTVELPEGIADAVRATAQSRAEEGAVLALWESGAFTTRDAAEELGLTYLSFLDLLAARGIPVESRPPDLKVIEDAERKLAAERSRTC